MTSPNAFPISSKFWFSGLLGERGLKGQKNEPKWQKILSHFLSQELYLIWLSFLVMCKMMISPANKKSDFSGFLKFINKWQKEILRCAPPSSHGCNFFVKPWLILSQLELSRTELPKCTPNCTRMENCDHTNCPVLPVFYMTQPMRFGFLTS